MSRGLLERVSRWWRGTPPRSLAERRGQRTALSVATGSYEAGAVARNTSQMYAEANLFEADWDVWSYLVTVRARSRHEMRNSGYLAGIVRTWATDVVGPRGPTLKIFSEDEEFNQALEYWWDWWTKRSDAGRRLTFAEWLRLGETQQWQAGEDLAQLVWVDDGEPLSFRVRSLEPDLLATPYGLTMDDDVVMGVRLGDAGEPLRYYVQEEFPLLGMVMMTASGRYHELEAREVIHDYRSGRPGQTRGMPWLTPVLDAATIYRDWIKTCLVAQQHAAKFSVVLTTEHPDAEFDDLDDELPTWDLEGGVAATFPRGWKAGQIRPEHPSTSFAEFSAEVMRQIARPVSMPLLRARCDASGANYTSGRMDVLCYWREVETREAELETRKCDRCLAEVQREAELRGLTPPAPPRWWAAWGWAKAPVIDDYKAAQATKLRIETGTSSLAEEIPDWEGLLEMRRRIEDRAEELGVELTPGKAEAEGAGPDTQELADLITGANA